MRIWHISRVCNAMITGCTKLHQNQAKNLYTIRCVHTANKKTLNHFNFVNTKRRKYNSIVVKSFPFQFRLLQVVVLYFVCVPLTFNAFFRSKWQKKDSTSSLLCIIFSLVCAKVLRVNPFAYCDHQYTGSFFFICS